jgi:uncharacterized protein
MVEETTKNIYVLYHGGMCMDGKGSAYAAWVKFKDTATYIAVNYSDKELPDMVLNKETEIYILDFSYGIETVFDLMKQVKLVQIIDHHKPVYKQFIEDLVFFFIEKHYNKLPIFIKSFFITMLTSILNICKSILTLVCSDMGLTVPIFNNTKSGAILSWEYFHKGTKIPMILQYIGDRDLWLFKLPFTKEAIEGLKVLGDINDFQYWDKVAKHESSLDEVINAGIFLRKSIKARIDSVVAGKKYKIVYSNGKRVALYMAVDLISETAEALYNDTSLNLDYTMSYFITNIGQIIFSFRSSTNSNVDVSKIAQKLGGNGHKHSAGASLSLSEGMSLLTIMYS